MVSYYLLGCLIPLTAIFLRIYLPMNYAEPEDAPQPEVTITQGTLRGKILTTRNGRNIAAYLGIPYARPPIGNLRFANPVPADSWKGTLNATVDTSRCPQILSGVFLGEEDCLYLNVYTPQFPRNTNASLLPVMVYIHGGGFQGEYPGLSGPNYLLDADVVLITMRYRVGSLGFLSTGDEVASGNWGLKDQVLALKWVQDNAQYFGGDPGQVTIFGESAGAGSVHLLTLSDMTIGLFHRYITQSGSALAKWAYRPRAVYSRRAFELGEYLGCPTSTSGSLISCLRKVDFTDIINTDLQFVIWKFLPDVKWGPTDEPNIEGAFLTDSPTNLLAAGKIRDLPWMSGVNREEGLLYISRFYPDAAMLDDFMENIDNILPYLLHWDYELDTGAGWVNAAKSHYLLNTSSILEDLTKLVGDVYFLYPACLAFQKHYALAKSPQYLYSFEYRGAFSFSYTFGGGTEDHGVAHSDDLIYLFMNDAEFVNLNKTMSETDYEMVGTMVQLWTSFAIDGKPTASALGDTAWEPSSIERNNYLRIGSNFDPALEVQYSLCTNRTEFWNDLYTAKKKQNDPVNFPELIRP